jgi:rhodanese-related sulfurtransferase
MPFPPTDTLEISATDTAALVSAGEKVRLIDCREQDEWHLCRIEGAELVPLSQFAEQARTRFTDPGERVIIHCHHGMRSAQAAHYLRQRGLPMVWSMAGGIEAWSCEVDAAVPRY